MSQELWQRIKSEPETELYKRLDDVGIHSYTKSIVETELRRRETEKNLKTTEQLVKASKGLVWATWGLVAVTLILTIVTFCE